MIQIVTPTASWHGKLDLAYDRCHNKTKLVRQQMQAPLKVQRSFYPEGEDICHNIILHTAGGIVGGDRLSQTLQLSPGSRVLLTTVAAGKVYGTKGRSRLHPQGIEAKQTIEIDLAENTCLEWLPRETIIFNGALFRQDLRVNLASGSTFLGWEIVRLGRTARGETFHEGEWKSHVEVYQNDIPVWIDRARLYGDANLLHSANGLNGQPVVASLVYLGHVIPFDMVTDIRQFCNSDRGEMGVTRLMSGLLCRYRGASTLEVREKFVAIWDRLRQFYMQRSACSPRVWF